MASSQCCENPPDLDPSSGGGRVEHFGGMKTYVSGPSDSETAILLVSDIYGFEAPILRKLADKVAAAGFLVVVPDYFGGDPFVYGSQVLEDWLTSHRPEKGYEDTKLLISALKARGVSSIGAAGFCWGAKVVVELAKHHDIQVAVMLHPSFVGIDDIKEVKCPLAILGAEIDRRSPPELVKQFEEILSAKSEVDSFVKIFPGVSHGWSVRYSVEDEAAVKSAEEAHQDMLGWLTKHL